MTYKLFRSTGICLVTGSLLIIITMVLHPEGGDMEYLISISRSLKISHAIGILSVPIALFGFFGLTKATMDDYKLSILAFIIIAFALFAALIAALLNGIILPIFLTKYAGEIETYKEVLSYFVSYNFTLNSAFDYIFIVGCCLSISIYSWCIIFSQILPKWVGYLGFLIMIGSIAGILVDFSFTSLLVFRFFTFSLSGWVLIAGISLFKTKQSL